VDEELFFFIFLNCDRYSFFTIFYHSPGGDTTPALSNTAFYTTYSQSPEGGNATALAEFALSECCYLLVDFTGLFSEFLFPSVCFLAIFVCFGEVV